MGARSTLVPRRIPRTPIAVAIALACQPVMAQQQLEEIIVTAQKRAENMQDVPISIQALGTEQLEQLHVNNFKDYVQMLPSVTMAPGAGGGYGAGAGFAAVYMRGVTTGGDGQAITSVPSVGMYLDEQPITTIQGNLDIHMYDIARVEALAGPQGTLYGASSQAGTIRIITNRPDPTGFDAGYGLEANMVDGDDSGYIAEGFINVPIGEQAAIRIVGWYREDAGWVDNVLATRTFSVDATDPDDDITVRQRGVRRGRLQHDGDVRRARGAARGSERQLDGHADVHDPESVQRRILGRRPQRLSSSSGDNAVSHFKEEYTDDEWWQAGLTIEGNISNFDLTYSGNYLDRNVEASFDYSDYSYFYDQIYYTGYFARLFFDNNDERADGVDDPDVGREGTRSSRRCIVTTTTTSTRSRATSSASPRRRTTGCAVCSASSGRSRSTTSGSPSSSKGSRTSCCRTRAPIRCSRTSCISTAWIARTPTRPCSAA